MINNMNYYGQEQSKTDIARFTKAAFLVLCAQVLYNECDAATYTITPNPIVTSATLGAPSQNGYFTDTFNFRVAPNSGGSVTVSNSGSVNFEVSGGAIENFSAVIDGSINLLLTETVKNNTVFNFLSQSFGQLSSFGTHTLTVSGIANWSSYGGQIQINPAPVPGAILLFGSSIAAFMGFSEKRKRVQS